LDISLLSNARGKPTIRDLMISWKVYPIREPYIPHQSEGKSWIIDDRSDKTLGS